MQVDLVICSLFISKFEYLQLKIEHFSGPYPSIYSHSYLVFLYANFGPYQSHLTRSTCTFKQLVAHIRTTYCSKKTVCCNHTEFHENIIRTCLITRKSLICYVWPPYHPSNEFYYPGLHTAVTKSFLLLQLTCIFMLRLSMNLFCLRTSSHLQFWRPIFRYYDNLKTFFPRVSTHQPR